GFRFALRVEGGATARVVRKGASDHREARFVHLANRTLRTLRQLRPEVIVTGELGLRTAQAILYARWTRTPIVCYWEGTGHTEARLSTVRRLWRRWLLRHLDAAWVNGIESADYLVGLGVARAAITSSMTGVDTEFFWKAAHLAWPERAARRGQL